MRSIEKLLKRPQKLWPNDLQGKEFDMKILVDEKYRYYSKHKLMNTIDYKVSMSFYNNMGEDLTLEQKAEKLMEYFKEVENE